MSSTSFTKSISSFMLLGFLSGYLVIAGPACKRSFTTDSVDINQVSSDTTDRQASQKESTLNTPTEPPPPHPKKPDLPLGVQQIQQDVITLALSYDGHFLVAGDLGGHVLLWETQAKRFLWRDKTPEFGRIREVLASESKELWLGGSFDEPDKPWRAWSMRPMERVGAFGADHESTIALAMDHQSQRVAAMTVSSNELYQTLALYDLGSGNLLWKEQVPLASRGQVALSPDGKSIAASGEENSVLLITFNDHNEPQSELLPLPEERSKVTRLEWRSTESGSILYGATNATLFHWDENHKLHLQSLSDDSLPVRALHRTASLAHPLVAVTRPHNGGLIFWNEQGQPIGYFNPGCSCEIHALSFDASTAACLCSASSNIRYGPVQWN